MVKSLGERMREAREDFEREQAIRTVIARVKRRARVRLVVAFLAGVVFGLLAIAIARADVPLTAGEAERIVQLTEDMCPPLEVEAFELEIIREERANPSGVVDLRRLHEAGGLLAVARATLKYYRAHRRADLKLFRQWAHKPIDLAYCEAWERRRIDEDL